MKKFVFLFSFVFFLGLQWQGYGLDSQNSKKSVKVFILAGQSNMEGHGLIKGRPDQKGTLENLIKNPKASKILKTLANSNGEWKTRDDVWISWLNKNGKLTVGGYAGRGSIGPELGFGWVIGDYLEEPVILLKFGPGGTSLAGPWRPPSSGPKDGEARGEKIGSQYDHLINKTKNILSNLDKYFPKLTGSKLEIAGLGWHQGWNDGCNMKDSKEYKQNLINFIKDVRRDLDVDNLPFVIAGSGFGGWEQSIDRRLMIINSQKSVTEIPELKGSTRYVETRDFFRDGSVSPRPIRYHWCCNAETYWLIGESMGKSMVGILNNK